MYQENRNDSFKLVKCCMLYLVLLLATFIVIGVLSCTGLVGATRALTANDMNMPLDELDPTTINTGDILSVAYHHGFGTFVAAATNSVWSHTAVAWKDPVTNEIFVLEGCNYHDRRGMLKVPLATWVRFNRQSQICINRLSTPADPAKVLQAFNNLRSIKLETFNWQMYKLLMKTAYEPVDMSAGYTCYEIAVHILQDSGIVSKQWRGSSYFPTDIVWGKLETMPGYTYSRPVLLNPTMYYDAVKVAT